MRLFTALLVLAAASLGALGSLVVSDARGSSASPAARTALERSVLHDQAAAGALAEPPFTVTRVRCVAKRGYCNVMRETNARRISSKTLVRVPIVVTSKRGWRYPAVDKKATAQLHSARQRGRVLWGISATWTD